jgi:hypothetical protein
MRMFFVALLLSLPLAAQEDLKKSSGDAVEALRKTAKSGSFEFAGILKTEVNPDEADAEATECKVLGAVASPFHSVFKVKTDSSTHEIAFKGGKLAGKLIWKGQPLDLGKAPSEVLSLVNLERLAVYAEKATAAKSLADVKDCRVLEIVLPKQTIRSCQEDAEQQEEEEKSVEKVELKVHVRKSDGLVVKLEATVHRLYKDEDNPDNSSKGRSEYAFTLKEFGAAKVTIPAGLEKLVEE